MIITYVNLPKYATVSKFVEKLRDAHWCIWIPIVGFVIQILFAIVNIYNWSKNIRIK
jgi:hypothetical protein